MTSIPAGATAGRRSRKTSPACLLRDPSESARARVFTFPYAGVGASMFSQWPRHLGDVEVCPIQLPARENRFREPHFGTYERLAGDIVEPLRPYLDRPFALFGHCAAALPAFELAHRLHTAGMPVPDHLVVSAQVAPHHCPFDRYLDLTDEQLLNEMGGLVRARGGEPDPTVLELMLGVLRQDLESNRAYRRAAPVRLPVHIVALHWDADVEIRREQLDGWSGYSESVSFEVLAGAHFDFLNAPAPLMALLAGLFGPGTAEAASTSAGSPPVAPTPKSQEAE
jgi:surfactin synthase thioesterase subunit